MIYISNALDFASQERGTENNYPPFHGIYSDSLIVGSYINIKNLYKDSKIMFERNYVTLIHWHNDTLTQGPI